MTIELLYFDGCPNHEAFLPHLRELLDRAGIKQQVRLRRVQTIEDAEREAFLGSPTLRIDGRDVEPGAAARRDYGFKCRLYRTSAGTSGVPADEWILQAFRRRGPPPGGWRATTSLPATWRTRSGTSVSGSIGRRSGSRS